MTSSWVCRPYRAASSCLRFRKFIAIIRQVRFSIRSWLGNCFLVLLYNLHICVANGSFFCISSGLSSSSPAASSFQVGKKLSRSNSLRALDAAEKSSLSMLLALESFVSAIPTREVADCEVGASCGFELPGLRGKRKSCSVIDVIEDVVVLDWASPLALNVSDEAWSGRNSPPRSSYCAAAPDIVWSDTPPGSSPPYAIITDVIRGQVPFRKSDALSEILLFPSSFAPSFFCLREFGRCFFDPRCSEVEAKRNVPEDVCRSISRRIMMMVRRMLCVTYTRLEDVIKQADALGRSDVQLSPSRPLVGAVQSTS